MRGARLGVRALLGAALYAGLACAQARAGVHLERVRVSGVTLNVVTADLSQPDVRVVTAAARGYPYRAESFSSLVARTQPAAAINGTYFGTSDLGLVGDLVVEGRAIYLGRVGTALALTQEGQARFVNMHVGRQTGWQGYRSVVCAGPRLIMDGQSILSPRDEGFSDPHVLGRARRSALGVTRDNKLLLVTTAGSVSLGQLARALSALRAYWAINLDGGTSSALYYRGHVITAPGRRLTNWILVYDSPQLLERVRHRLLPSGYLAFADRSKALRRRAGDLSVRGIRDGSTISGAVHVLIGIARQQRARWAAIFVDDASRCIANAFPYDFAWDTRVLADGPHTLSVELYDANGAVVAAQALSVQVRNRPLPAEPMPEITLPSRDEPNAAADARTGPGRG